VNATALFLENKRLSSSKQDLGLEIFKQNEMLETLENKIKYYNNSITRANNDPTKKSILIAICEKYSSRYNKGIACNSRKTLVSNILEQLLRIDIDIKENTIEEEIANSFKIPMFVSAN